MYALSEWDSNNHYNISRPFTLSNIVFMLLFSHIQFFVWPDASDWDSASTTSKRTLPGRRIVSHGLEEFPEHSSEPGNEQEGDDTPAGLSTPQTTSSGSNKKLQSTPSKSAPYPQAQTKKMVLQKQNSDKGKDAPCSLVVQYVHNTEDKGIVHNVYFLYVSSFRIQLGNW